MAPTNRYRFEIIDTGKGIAAENLKNLFQPFYQGAEGVKKGGTGLGLAITRRQVELMGGTIDVESHPGQGSRFFFEVPLAPAKGQVTARGAEPAREVLSLAEGCTVKALVVDDVRQNREVLSQLLCGIGCQVELAEDGLAALKRLRAGMPDIVFMDIRMPGMDGPEVARRMFEEFGRDRVKLVAISASVLAHERQSYLEAGFDAFVGKPFRFEKLCDCLRRLLKVEFEYAGPEAKTGATPRQALDLANVALPENILAQLRDAAARYSATGLEQGAADLEQTGEPGREVAAYLRGLVQAENFKAVAEWLKQIRPL